MSAPQPTLLSPATASSTCSRIAKAAEDAVPGVFKTAFQVLVFKSADPDT